MQLYIDIVIIRKKIIRTIILFNKAVYLQKAFLVPTHFCLLSYLYQPLKSYVLIYMTRLPQNKNILAHGQKELL